MGRDLGTTNSANIFAEIPKLTVLAHLAHSSAASPNLVRGPRVATSLAGSSFS